MPGTNVFHFISAPDTFRSKHNDGDYSDTLLVEAKFVGTVLGEWITLRPYEMRVLSSFIPPATLGSSVKHTEARRTRRRKVLAPHLVITKNFKQK